MSYKLETAAFARLLGIMDELRAKCPWDQSQTIESLRHLTIEETYELSDAIIENNPDEIRGELGDLMLHLVFYAKIGSETNQFNITQVIDGICEKLIIRHPHIFGDVIVKDANEVKDNWERIKITREGKKSVLSGVPESLPALIKAYRMQEKAAGVGFDWENGDQVWEKVQEELNEFKHEIASNTDTHKVESEFGDIMFALVNYARFINVNPEDALEKTNKKFRRRLNHIEKRAREIGKPLHEMTLTEMDAYWNEAKAME
ncbi:MAG TPA: nucleoside triphosphate pyrophosphohydrolase [Bacteroidales bacterium]|nr:MAG: nucleoside triphosphate pyrophosphohydrolase [Bacteroidetes bacterium GWE2_42_24]OFY29937.1 MAG: nucleoside triphosphate pyrophosphohydrolase [Bacteroidetes bacterium GWF2_43_11]HBZ67877.1 nucleoside triphosphate pyrophosphohydrolase [Bacteroidales bacterium]